jgi:succinate dehydrogenase/fumarate reductase flavoprotein subunit
VNRIETDVLVIGGGPAGCMAGIAAAKRGMSVCVCDKGAIKKSGNAGAGIDHWNDIAGAPGSSQTPEEKYENNKGDGMCIRMLGRKGPTQTHRDYIATKGSWDALLELEKMGLPIRDVDGDFDGNPSQDEDTKLLKSYNYNHMNSVKLRGGNFVKPVMYNELKKLGAKLFDRVMMTSLLTENGKQGARVVGAMGFSMETGEFYVFSAKSVIISTGYVCSMWIYSMEITGNSFRWDPNDIGEGLAMAYTAGAKVNGFFSNGSTNGSHPFAWPRFGVGDSGNTWSYCNIVDNNGKPVPWKFKDGTISNDPNDRTSPPNDEAPHMPFKFNELMASGEYEAPFWADLSSMPERERRSIWGMMVGNEGKTRYTLYDYYTRNGFNPEKHLLWCPIDPVNGKGSMHGDPNIVKPWRSERGGQGEVVVDWDLMTNIPGLYAAGATSGLEGLSYACSSGTYAGNRAAEFSKKVTRGTIDENQIEAERSRVYAPTERLDDPEAYVSWKELWGGTARVMQQCCGELLTKPVLEFGINWLNSIKNTEAKKTFARNPHELGRVMECETRITVSELYLRACISKIELEDLGAGDDKFLFNYLENGEFKSEVKDKLFYLQGENKPTYLENYNLHRKNEKE